MSKQPLKILIIDDHSEDRARIRLLLERDEAAAYQFIEEEDGAKGIETCSSEKPDCVLLDFRLPDSDGLSVLSAINADALNPLFPVILLADAGDDVFAAKSVRQGAQNYLIKGEFSAEMLRRAVRAAIEAVQLRRRQKQTEDISKRYHLLVDASRDIMLFFHADGQIIEANRAALDAYGYTREEILAKNFYDIRARETWAEIPEQMRQVEKGAFQFETVHCRKDGSRFPVEASWSFAETDGERVILSIVRDISERKKAEAELREKRHYIKQIVEIVPSVVYVRDLRDGKNVFINRSVVDALGYTPEDVLALGGDFVKSVMHPDDYARIPEREGKFGNAADNEIVEFEYRMRHKSGEWHWFLSRDAVFLRDDSGKPFQVIGTATDITTRKQAEEVLRESTLRYQTLAEISPYAVFINFDGKIVYVNRECIKLFGAAGAAEITGKSPFDFIHSDFHEIVRQRIAAMKAKRQIAPTIEEKIIRLDGETVDVEVAAATFAEKGKEAILVTMRDITGQKKAEARLNESQLQMHLALEAAQTVAFTWDIKTDLVRRLHSGVEAFPETDNDTLTGVAERILADDREKFLDNLKTAIANPHLTYRAEYRVVQPDGKIAWLSEIGRFMTDENGEAAQLTGISTDITERKIIEEQLRASEARLHLGVEVADFVICQIDYTTGKIHLSKEAAMLYGVGNKEISMPREQVHATFHPDDTPELMRQIAGALIPEGDGWFALEHRIVRENGEVRWLNVRKQIFFDHAQNPPRPTIGILAAQDITERKEAEEEIRQNEQRFKQLANSLPQLVWTCEPDGPCDFLSRRWADYTGIPEAEQLGFGWLEQVHPDDREPTIAAWKKAVAEGTNFKYEFRVRRFDGVYRLFDTRAVRLFDSDGKTVKWFGTNTDVTERKEAEEALRVSHDTFRHLVENSPFGVYVVDADFRLSLVGVGARKVFENVRPLIGRDFSEVLRVVWAEPFASEAIALFRHTLETGEPYHSPSTVERRGDISEIESYDWKIERITMPDGRFGVVCYFYDLSDRQRYEAQIRESEERFRLASDAGAALVYDVDLTGKRAVVAYGLERVTGYQPGDSDLSSVWWHGLIHEEDLPAHLENYARHLETGGTSRTTYRVRHKKGKWIWVEDTAQVIKNDEGKAIQLVGAIVDITTRREAEEKLRYQLQLTQSITDSAGVAIFVSDGEGRITFLNPEAEKIFGYTLGELKGKVLHDAIHYKYPDGTPFPMSECPLGKVYQNGRAVRDYESTFFRKDGSPVSVICSNTPIIENGEVTGEVMAMLDITTRKTEELNAELLLRVGELIRETDDADTLFGDVARLLGERLSAARCLFNEIDLENETATVQSEYARAGLPSYIGTISTGNYSELTRIELENRQTVVVADTQTDRRTAAWFEKSYRAEGIGAYIACPLMREGVWTATLWLSSDEPREWQEWEITLVQTAAERAWLAAEKLRSERQVRESEERFRLLTENLDNVFWIFNWREKRGEYVSPAVERLYSSDYAGSLMVEFKNWTDVIHPDDRERAESDFLAIEESGKYESIYRIVLSDGSIRWRHAKGSPIRDESGEILRVVGVTEDITDRKLAELQILESEERLRLATDVAEMFSWENDFVSQKIKWSDNAAKIIGCEPAELPSGIGDAMFFVASDERRRIFEIYEQALRDGKNNYVVEFRGANDQYWQAHGSIIRDAQGGVVKVVGVTQNVTERRKNEEKIQTANYRFRVAEEAAKGFNYEWNLETGTVTRSEAIERVLGYRRDELPKTWQSWTDLMHPDDSTVASEAEAIKFLKGLKEETFTGEYRARHKDGHYIWLMERGLLIRDEDGELRRVIGQTMDITAQKDAQEKLLEAERRATSDYRKLLARIAPLAQTLGTARELTTIYRALLDFIRFEIPCEGFFVSFYDAENQIKQVKYVWSEGKELDARAMQPIPLFKNNGANSRALREGKSIITTRNLETMSGQFQVVSETSQRTVESLVTPMIVMGRAIGTLEVQNHSEKYVQEHIVALEMAANLAAVAIENVRLMNIESKARAAAEEASRAKDDFLAMLSHELRSPLNAMFGWTQILQNTKPNAEQTEKAVEVIARNVRLQKTLIEDLLDVSRIISGKMLLENENVSLVSIVQASVDAARPAAEKQGIEIEMNLTAASDEIFGDKHRLQQIVGNLLTNAVKFTPAGGKIRILLENAGEKIRLMIEDTGIGIASDLLPRIFDRFRQADGGYKRKYGGLGLGLTIVKHLAELHGGTVSAFSEGDDKGARFTVEFPLVPRFIYPSDAPSPESAQVFSQNLKSLDGARILAVDDDSDVLDLISFVLREEGASVTCCNSAREALEFLRDGFYDLLISDLGMAEIDGFDLIKSVRENENGSRQLPAVALTGFVSAQDRQRVLAAGFQNHLSKPVDLDKLLTVAVGLIKNADDARNIVG